MEQSDFVTIVKPKSAWGKWALVRLLENGKLIAMRDGKEMGEVTVENPGKSYAEACLWSLERTSCQSWYEMPEKFKAAILAL